MPNPSLTPDEQQWVDAEIARLAAKDQVEAAAWAKIQEELEPRLIDALPGQTTEIPCLADPPARQRSFIIVGAGIGGLCMASRLLAAGYENVVILEKSDQLGGTWNHNRYPGVACDVASYFYSFSTFPNPDWSEMHPPGSEIKAYLDRFADHFGLRARIQFNTEVASCRFHDGRWTVTVASGERLSADMLIPATGFLHFPSIPNLPGLKDFAGLAVHSSQWRPDTDTSGKRVVIIGSGSTSTQILQALVDKADHVSIFQRTAQWILPSPKDIYSPQRRKMLASRPAILSALYRHHHDTSNEGFGEAVVGNAEAYGAIREQCEANLARVADPELRRKLTPDYPVMCKRLIFSAAFYDALARDNAALITEPIEKIEADGVRTRDGVLHPADILILATGFQTHVYFRNLNISVDGGTSLDEAWTRGARSFDSVALAGFPNLLFINGPFTAVGNLSLIAAAELQVDYIMRLLRKMDEADFDTIMPRPEAEQAFVDDMKAAMKSTVWKQGCDSWYLNEFGEVSIWTRSSGAFAAHLRMGPQIAHFDGHKRIAT